MLKSGTEMNFLLIHSQCPVWRKLTSVSQIFTVLPINGYLQGHNKSSGSLFQLDSLNEEIMNDNEEEEKEVPEEKSLIPNSCQVITK